MSTGDDKRYVGMEPVLQAINKSYISLAEDNVKRNNPILKQVRRKLAMPFLLLSHHTHIFLVNRRSITTPNETTGRIV